MSAGYTFVLLWLYCQMGLLFVPCRTCFIDVALILFVKALTCVAGIKGNMIEEFIQLLQTHFNLPIQVKKISEYTYDNLFWTFQDLIMSTFNKVLIAGICHGIYFGSFIQAKQ